MTYGSDRTNTVVPERFVDRSRARNGPERFAVTPVSVGQRCINVALHGELDATTAFILHSQLAFFHMRDAWVMAADMTDVTSVDPDGVTAIVDAHEALQFRSCALTITNPPTTVRVMLGLRDLTSLIAP